MINHARVGVVSCLSLSLLFLSILSVPINAASTSMSMAMAKKAAIQGMWGKYPLAIKRCIDRFLLVKSDQYVGKPIDPRTFRVLLHGPTGSGKTRLVEQLAKQHGFEFVHIKTPTLLNEMQNSAATEINSRFAEIADRARSRKCKGIFVLFDEGNALGTRYSIHKNKDDTRAEEAFWLQLDDWKRFHRKVMFFVATNKKDELSPMLLDRFSPNNDIEIANPDAESIREILSKTALNMNCPELLKEELQGMHEQFSRALYSSSSSQFTKLINELIAIDVEMDKVSAENQNNDLCQKLSALIGEAEKLNNKLFFENERAMHPDTNTEDKELNKDISNHIDNYLKQCKKHLTQKREPLSQAVIDKLTAGCSNMSVRSITGLIKDMCILADIENNGKITPEMVDEQLSLAQQKLQQQNKRSETEQNKETEAKLRELQIKNLETTKKSGNASVTFGIPLIASVTLGGGVA